MKSTITAIVVTVCLTMVILIIVTINNFQARKNEMEESLSVAMDASMEALKYKYSDEENFPKEYERVIADLNQNLLLQVSSESDITINVLRIDLEKGLIDVEAVQTYKWHGISKEISVRRTIILEEYQEATFEANVFDVTFEVDGSTYDVQHVTMGKTATRPTDPTKDGYIFKGWYVKGDTEQEIITDAEWEYLSFAEDVTLAALFSANE